MGNVVDSYLAKSVDSILAVTPLSGDWEYTQNIYTLNHASHTVINFL